AEKTALAIAWPMQLFYKTFSYPIRLLDWAGTRTVRLLGLHPTSEHASIYTADELRQLIDVSRRKGHIEVEERLVDSIFEFSDAEVREAMIPRTEVQGITETATLDEVKKVFRSSGYSRLPVYHERLDDVVGTVSRRDLEPYLENPPLDGFNLRQLVRSAQFIPANARLGAALTRMQASRAHLAVVVDEHGGMEGIVTMEDLLEEIVGEINDEFDEEVRSQISKELDGSYVLSGMLTVRDANRRLKLDLPEDSGYTTLAGFLMAQAGRLLQPNEAVTFQDLVFTVERVERRRIRRVRLRLPEPKQDVSMAMVPFISSFAFEPLAACLL
ncbi:MAG: hemolysin family protein, partial [Pyrinomonadaceae bacterium]